MNIIRKEKLVVCSGFYKLNNVNIEQLLRDIKSKTILNNDIWEDFDYPYSDLCVFLHGSCQLFALALNKKFNYPVYELVQKDKMLHSFCIVSYKCKKLYIDIRGATSDFEEFMQGVYMIDGYEYILQQRDIHEDEKLNKKWDDIGYALAQAIIEKFPTYYNLHDINGK